MYRSVGTSSPYERNVETIILCHWASTFNYMYILLYFSFFLLVFSVNICSDHWNGQVSTKLNNKGREQVAHARIKQKEIIAISDFWLSTEYWVFLPVQRLEREKKCHRDSLDKIVDYWLAELHSLSINIMIFKWIIKIDKTRERTTQKFEFSRTNTLWKKVLKESHSSGAIAESEN